MRIKYGKSNLLIKIILIVFVLAVFINYGNISVYAVDGSGTNSVSPASTTISSTGNTFTFTFTSAETMNSGGIQITTPSGSGFSTPTSTNGVAGYTTATSTSGMVGTVLDTADSVSSWVAGTACATVAPVATTSIKQEGIASIVCRNGNEASGDVWYNNITAQNWSGYSKVRMWIRSSAAITAGNLQFAYDDSANLASPLATTSIGAISANTWTYVVLSFGATTRTSVVSYGFRINSASGVDNAIVYVDDVLLGPGTPTFPSAGNINVRILQLATSSTLTVSYGSGGGASGVTTPGTTGTYIATTTARISDAGTLTNIGSHPTIILNKANQATLTTIVTPSSLTYGSTSILSSSGGSGTGAISFSHGASTGCSVSGTTLSITDVSGSCSVTATKAADTNYNSATSAGVTVTLSKANQASLTAIVTPSSLTYGSTSILSSSGGSGTGAVTFSHGASTGCSVSGTTLSITDVSGSCSVTATKAADTNYNSATSAGVTVTLSKASQATLTAIVTPSTLTYGSTSVLSSSGGSGTGAVTFSHGASTGCSVSGTTLSITDVSGSCSVTATKAADTNYNSATSAGVTVTLSKANQATLTTIVTPSSLTYGSTSVLSSSGGSGTGAVTFSHGASTGCSVSGTTLSITDVSGSCSVTATKAADTNYNSATSAGVTVTLSKASQATLTAIVTPSTLTYGSTSVLSSSGGSGTGAVTFSHGASTGCSVSGTTLSITDVSGTCSVTATKAADTNYNSATSAGVTVTLSKANQATLTTIVTPSSLTYGSTSVLSSSGGSGTGAVTFSHGASTGCSVSGTTLSITDVSGSCSVTATKAADTNYNSATSAGVTVTLLNLVPVTTSISPTSGFAGGSSFTLTVNGSNFIASSVINWDGSARTTTFVSATQLTALINSSDIALAGSAIITVTTPSAGGGTSNEQTFTLTNPVPTISSISPSSRDSGTSGFTLTLIGTNFMASGTVKWNGSARTTTFVSSTRVTAVINSSDIATSGSANITFANPTPGGGDSNTEVFTITVPAPPATKFVIINPTDSTVGNNVTVTVQAQDASNNIVTTYQNDVTLSASGQATGAGLVNITNGVGTIQISDETAETVTLSLSDTQATSLDVNSTQDVIFAPGAISQFTLSSPADTTAGARAAYIVTRKDQYGNLVTTGASSAYLFTSATAGLSTFYSDATASNTITSITIADGASTADFWYAEGRVGTYSVTVSDNSSSPNGTAGIDDASDSITISSGATSLYILNNPGDMSVGTRLGYTVTRKDAYGNLATGGSDVVRLYSSSESLTKAFYDAGTDGNLVTSITIADGSSVANFWYFDDTAGTWTISASDNTSAPDGATGIGDATDSVTVSLIPIVATKIIILDPSDSTAGNVTTVTIKAVDNAGSLDASWSGSVTLDASGASLGDGIITIVGGIGTANLTDNIAETVNLTLSDSGATGLDVSSAQDVIFAPGPLSKFTINEPGNGVAGTRFAYTVTRKDQYNNLVTSGISTVYLYTNSLGVQGKFYDLASGGSVINSVNITNGQSVASFWYEEGTVGSWNVTLSDNNSAPDGDTGIIDVSDPITITPASTMKFALNDPGNMTQDTRIGYVVTRKDAYGNLVTSGNQNVYLFSTATSSGKAFYNAATVGNIITTVVIPDGDSTANFWYFDNGAGGLTVTASDNSNSPDGSSGITDATDSVTVSTIPIVATKLIIGTVSDTLVGGVVTITVTAEDDNGNTATTHAGDVTLNATGAVSGAGILHITNGVGTIDISDNIPQSITLSLSDSANTGLNVDSTQSFSFVTVVAPQQSSGGGGGGSNVSAPKFAVNFTGQAFPGSLVNIFGIPTKSSSTQAITLNQQQITSGNGAFKVSLTNTDTKSKFYFVGLTDKNNISGQVKIFANIPDVTTLSNIVFAPTISLLRSTIRQGDFLSISGYANPGSVIEVEFDGTKIAPETVTSGSDGSYKLLISTAGLSLGKHSVRVRHTINGKQSDFSLTKTFSLSNVFNSSVDFNTDGKVDVRDMNIFVSSWISSKPEVKIKDDLNSDGKVDIQDLSIFAQSLKK